MKTHKTTLEDISAVVGFTATARLAAWFGDGNQNVYVPKKVEEGMLLVKLIGMSAAKRLVSEWPGKHLAVPTLRDYEDDRRKRFIGRMLESGFSDREIAGRLRVSERRVAQVCRELEVAGLINIVVPRQKGGGKIAGEIAPENSVENMPLEQPSFDPALENAFRSMQIPPLNAPVSRPKAKRRAR